MPRSAMSIADKLAYGIDAFGKAGFSRDAALGALGSLAGESGFGLNTAAHNPNDPNGGAFGVGQWHSERKVAMQAYSAQPKYAGVDPFKAQIDYALHELATSHKRVGDKLKDPNISRVQAAKTWTKEFEVPAKAYERMAERISYANRYAAMADKLPQANVNPAMAAVDAAPFNAQKAIEVATRTVTGVDGYVDPTVNAQGYAEAQKSKPKNEAVGAIESILGGTAEAINGVATGVSGFVGGLAAGDVDKAFKSVPGGPVAGTTSQEAAAAAGAAAQPAEKGFFSGDANIGAAIGSLASGMFGGPMGAVAGGLAGQGIARALAGMTGISALGANAEDVSVGGMAGGIGRAMDSLFGGLSGMFSSAPASAAAAAVDTASPSYGKDFFPSAPDAPAQTAKTDKSGGYGGFSSSEIGAAHDWAGSHPDAAGKAGLY